MSAASAAPSLSATNTSRSPRSARTGHRMPLHCVSSYPAAARAASANARGRTSSASASTTDRCTRAGSANSGALNGPRRPDPRSARRNRRPAPPIAASIRMASSIPANPGNDHHPRTG